jgi:hypothetical protein
VQRLREELHAVQPRIDQFAAEVVGLPQTLDEECRRRLAAEQRPEQFATGQAPAVDSPLRSLGQSAP